MPSIAEQLLADEGHAGLFRYLNHEFRDEPCEYGHYECASTKGGACSNEVDSLAHHCTACDEPTPTGRDCCTDNAKHIGDYFAAALRRIPADESLAELPVDSECGDECVKVIDAAAHFVRLMKEAGGADMFAREIAAAIDGCEHVVSIYWRS